MSALLSLKGVGKRYWRGELSHWLLRRVTLQIAAGEVVSVVAMRGQGKTTLLRLAAGMVAPDEGRVLLEGHNPEDLSDQAHAQLLRERIGLAGRLGPGIDVRMRDYVAMRLSIGGRSRRREVHARALEALEQMGAEQCAERHWQELSDWERALVEIAQAIVGTPRLLLIDDLLDGLGMRETDELARLIRALAEDREVGVLMAVSDPEAALGSHRVLSLADGRLSPLSPIGDAFSRSPVGDTSPLSPIGDASPRSPTGDVAPLLPAAGGAPRSFENVIDFPRSSAPGRRDVRRR
jgi:putative ABC transport system ATP-binding protein